MSAEGSLLLVDATGRVLRAGKRGAIPLELASILARLDPTFVGWRSMLGRDAGAHDQPGG
jgi:hypothetical protein